MLERFIIHFCLVVSGAIVLGAEGAVVGAVAGSLTAKAGIAGTVVLVSLLEWLCVEFWGYPPKGMLLSKVPKLPRFCKCPHAFSN